MSKSSDQTDFCLAVSAKELEIIISALSAYSHIADHRNLHDRLQRLNASSQRHSGRKKVSYASFRWKTSENLLHHEFLIAMN